MLMDMSQIQALENDMAGIEIQAISRSRLTRLIKAASGLGEKGLSWLGRTAEWFQEIGYISPQSLAELEKIMVTQPNQLN